jgi:hypothetical protein
VNCTRATRPSWTTIPLSIGASRRTASAATSTICALWCCTLTARGVRVQFVKEQLTFTGEVHTAMATLLLSVMGAFAEFATSD